MSWLGEVCSFPRLGSSHQWLKCKALKTVNVALQKVWLGLSTVCTGPTLVSNQEVAPFLCPVGSGGSLLWGGKRRASMAWAAIPEALRHWFSSSTQTHSSLEGNRLGFNSAAAGATFLLLQRCHCHPYFSRFLSPQHEQWV